MTSFDSADAENPLVPFSETATKSPALGDSAPNNLGAIGVGSTGGDPVSVRPLSQMAWEQMNPQQQAEATADVLTGSSTSQAIGVGAGGGSFQDGVFFDAAQGGYIEPDGLLGDFAPSHGGRQPDFAAGGQSFHTDDPTKGERIVEFARSMLGRPYIWGGTSRAGVDCSGLVQLAYAAAGIAMPRLSYDQIGKGKQVALNKLQPGDLIGWDNDQAGLGGVDHIAIYIGNGQYIEAPRPGLAVRIGNLSNTAISWAVRIPGKGAPAAKGSSPRLTGHPTTRRRTPPRLTGHPTTRRRPYRPSGAPIKKAVRKGVTNKGGYSVAKQRKNSYGGRY